MEKMNIINVIVSIFLMVAGAGFCLYVFLTNAWSGSHIMFLIIGILLVAYGIIRMVLTNRVAQEIK